MRPAAPDPVRLVVIRNPFDPRERDERLIAAPVAPTIAALVGDYLPAGTADGTALVVSVNGEVIPRADWAGRTLAPGEQMVAMPVLHDVEDMFGTILTIALMVVAPELSTFLYTSMGGTFVSAYAGLAITAIGAGISLLGSAVIGALTAPDRPQLPGAGQGYDNSPSYAWQPITTQAPGLPVARAYGRVKLYGNIIAGYIESTGDTGREQTAHLLIDLGQGPVSRLHDFRINSQPLDYYQGVTLIERRGALDQDVIPAFDDTRLTRAIGAKVVLDTPVVRDTVGSDFDALEIVIVFPRGLFYANDEGGLSEISVRYTVEISADAGATWRHVATTPRTESATVLTYQWIAGWANESGYTVLQSGSSVPTDHYEGEMWYDNWSVAYWHWAETSTTVYTDYDEDITTTAASTQPIRKTFRADHLTRGIAYQVRVSNLTTDQTTGRYGDDLYLAEINEVLYDDFEYPRSVLVGIKALATDQLNGGLQFDCLADAAIIRVWDGAAWAAEFSRNPAWIAWDILTQPVFDNSLAVLRYDGLDPSRLDLTAFYAWAQWCDEAVPIAGGSEARCLFDGIFDTAGSCWEAALEVAASARAVLLMRGTTVTVVWDRARSVPAQVFSVGNTVADSFRETFLPMQDRAVAIEVDFLNAEDGHARDKIVIVNAGVTEAAAQRVQFSNRGIRRASQAWREAMFRLKRNELLRRSAEIGVDIDALACEVGDLIYVQDDIARWGEGGRLVGGSATTLTLDKAITLAPDTAYSVTLRLADDSIETRGITTAAGAVSALTVDTAFSGTPAAFDVWAVAETARSLKPFLVVDVARDGDQRTTLSLLEYNASLYEIDAGAATVPTADYSAPALPTVSDLAAEERMYRANDGTITVDLMLSWAAADAGEVEIRVNGTLSGTSRSGVFRIANVISGQSYTLAAHPRDLLGRLAPPTQRAEITVTVVGKSAKPSDVTGFGIAGTRLFWDAVADVDLAGYRIRYHYGANADWGTGNALHAGLLVNSPYLLNQRPVGTVTLMIRAVDTSGNESETLNWLITNLGDAPVANVVESHDFRAAGWPGTISGATVSGGDLVATQDDPFYKSAAADFYGYDSDPFYNPNYDALEWVSTGWTPSLAAAGSALTLAWTLAGNGQAVQYRPTGPGEFYGAGAADFYGADADPFYDPVPAWQSWPGSIVAANTEYQWRVATSIGATAGVLSAFTARVDVPDRALRLDGVAIAAPGTRLAGAIGTFSVIQNIQLTLQGGSTAVAAIINDYSASLGPLITAIDSTGTGVAATIDAYLQGY